MEREWKEGTFLSFFNTEEDASSPATAAAPYTVLTCCSAQRKTRRRRRTHVFPSSTVCARLIRQKCVEEGEEWERLLLPSPPLSIYLQHATTILLNCLLRVILLLFPPPPRSGEEEEKGEGASPLGRE